MVDFLCELLKDVATVYSHSGGYFVWIECQPHIDAMQVYQEALRLNITIAPGKLFSVTEQYDHCFRLNASFELNEARRNQLRKLAHFIKELSKEEQYSTDLNSI